MSVVPLIMARPSGKHGDLMAPAGESQREFVAADCAQSLEPQGQLRQIERPPQFMNLHRIAAA